jgi:hypothetical protein
VVIVCIARVEVGEEILLDYGESYNKCYFEPQPPKPTPVWRPVKVGDAEKAERKAARAMPFRVRDEGEDSDASSSSSSSED